MGSGCGVENQQGADHQLGGGAGCQHQEHRPRDPWTFRGWRALEEPALSGRQVPVFCVCEEATQGSLSVLPFVRSFIGYEHTGICRLVG